MKFRGSEKDLISFEVCTVLFVTLDRSFGQNLSPRRPIKGAEAYT